MNTWIWIILLVVLFGFVIPEIVIAGVIYTILLVRTSKKKWGRDVLLPENDDEYAGMYHEGLEWGELYSDYMREVEIKSGRYRLVGEYFDFGGEKAAIVIAGRMEDMQCWSRLLVEELHNKAVFLHGICIGSSVALFALCDENCPDYIEGMCADGMYVNFAESFKNHMIEDHRPKVIFSWLVFMYMRIFSHANVTSDGPINRIDRLKKPILFIHSRQDTYSTPDQAEKLFEKCKSPNKRLVWFEKGRHSRVRVNAPEKYDNTIIEFLKDLNK